MSRKVVAIPTDGGALAVTEKTIIDFLDGTIAPGEGHFDELEEPAKFLYVDVDANILVELEQEGSMTLTLEAAKSPYTFRNLPHDLSQITLRPPPVGGGPSNVVIVASSDKDFEFRRRDS